MTPYYDEGGITLYHGDCREVLPHIAPYVDLIATDPPYGIEFRSNKRTATEKFRPIAGDATIDGSWLEDADRLLAASGAIYVATRWDVYDRWLKLIAERFVIRNCVVWAKGGGGMGDLEGNYIPEHEFFIFGCRKEHQLRGKRISNVWSVQKDPPATYLHPTQKPVSLMSRIIEKSSDPGALVLDPFCGSGTTLVAAQAMNRRAIGIELEERYCEIIVKRLAQLPLFGALA